MSAGKTRKKSPMWAIGHATVAARIDEVCRLLVAHGGRVSRKELWICRRARARRKRASRLIYSHLAIDEPASASSPQYCTVSEDGESSDCILIGLTGFPNQQRHCLTPSFSLTSQFLWFINLLNYHCLPHVCLLVSVLKVL